MRTKQTRGLVKLDLHTSHAYCPVSEFLSLKASIYSASSLPIRIASYVVGKPLWWALEQIGIVGEEGILGTSSRDHHRGTAWHGDYVVVSLLEKAAAAVLELHRVNMAGPADALYSLDTFKSTFGSVLGHDATKPLSDQDAKLLLRFLERDRRLVVYDREVRDSNVSTRFLEADKPLGDQVRRRIRYGRGAAGNPRGSWHSRIVDCGSTHAKPD